MMDRRSLTFRGGKESCMGQDLEKRADDHHLARHFHLN